MKEYRLNKKFDPFRVGVRIMVRLPRLKPVAIGKFDPFSGVEKFRPAGDLVIDHEVVCK
jgi:hypothetical protein